MNQRGITQRMIDIVSQLGISKGDKKILDKNNIDELINRMDVFRKDLLKLRDKGGLVVVEANDALITAYRVDSYNRSKVA
jgi:hypothetical protein